MVDLPDLSRMDGFDWDHANVEKNWERHRVSFYECEEVFLRGPIVFSDTTHSGLEERHFALGKTVRERLLTIVFTLRKNKVRVISARPMSRKERKVYEQAQKDSKI